VARFLFVVPPFTGHVNPTVAVGRELTRRRHAVAWAGPPALVAPLLDPGAQLVSVGDDRLEEAVARLRERASTLRGLAALQFLWLDVLRPLAVAMAPGIEAAADDFGPDVFVVDQQAFAGSIVARRRGLPWVTSATTSAELVDSLAGLPKVAAGVHAGLVQLQVELGVDPATAARGDLRFSDLLVLAFTTEALAGPPAGLPAGTGPIAMVGAAVRGEEAPGRDDPTDFPWDWVRSGDEPLVLVSLGTLNAEAGHRFFEVAMEAFDGSPWRAVLVAPPELVGAGPKNVLVRPWVPQMRLLDHVSAVVCHAGHNTVCESLSKGIPLVVAPIRDDQPVVAAQVERAGAGVRVRFGRVRAAQLAAAVGAVLSEPSYRTAARVVQASFAAAGGARAAADQLEMLVA
jgi:UDP:flavonoid glycosyltransferase YjiC (YdhE family)